MASWFFRADDLGTSHLELQVEADPLSGTLLKEKKIAITKVSERFHRNRIDAKEIVSEREAEWNSISTYLCSLRRIYRKLLILCTRVQRAI